jgi:uncharacterized protein (TIGR02246 family)
MRKRLALTLVAAALGSACRLPADGFDTQTIVALERGALERWGKGDPAGFVDIMAAEETYFDPAIGQRIDGRDAMKTYMAPLIGKISIERIEMIDPKVQRVGDLAVLTFNLNDYGAQLDGGPRTTARWNSTEVYRRIQGSWKIVHSHWSYVKPDLNQTGEARDADARAIREFEAVWAKAWAGKDLDGILEHYADDASVELANTAVLSGKPAIRAALRSELSDPHFALAFAPLQVEVSKGGDLAYARGEYSVTRTSPTTGRPGTSHGKYIVVYRKQDDGRWRAIHDINNSDAP